MNTPVGFRTMTLTAGMLAGWFSTAIAADVSYERDVRPILKTNCFHCHGEGSQLEGGLDLRMRRLILQGGDSGTSLVPGKPEESVLYERIAAAEMPPPEVEKKLTAAEIDTVKRWIAAGAPTLHEEPADADPSTYLTEEERSFWAFQPVGQPTVPNVRDPHLVRSPVDRFILARLEQAGLTFAPEAERATLLRRLTFDLIGLPPTPEELADFLADRSPAAYERAVDRLLASPHYGERWGRHWLDAAGYADSEGYHDDDTIRPDAWRYRDYVLRAFNHDKPYDRFLWEQLAGDELVGHELTNLTEEEREWVTATGFLRMAPDGTASSGIDQSVARNEVIAKTIEITSTALMGLTIGCAQCHNHRYDPISQEDYYAFRAVLEPALDWKNWRTPPARRVSLYTDADRQQAAEIEARAKEIDAARTEKQEQFIARTLEQELAKLPTEMRDVVRAARDTPAKERTAEQKKLLQQHPSVNVSAGSLYLYDRKAADELKKMADEANRIRQQKPREEFLRALSEPVNQTPPPTFFFVRGLFEQPQQPVPPRPPRILAANSSVEFPLDNKELPTTGRRLALARWLTSKDHPLTARVMVNRVWMHHFGRGIVETAGDFGFLGARPSHPELLDWLAGEFQRSGWSVKHLHRLLVTSTTYRQSSSPRSEVAGIDDDNRLYSRMTVRRLEAEVLRDAWLAVSGQLQTKAYGPPIPVMADNVGQYVLGIENLDAGRPGAVVPMRGEDLRRSVYAQVRRSRPLSVLDPFDLPRMEPNCTRRASSTVAPQSLLLMNNEFVVKCAAAFADRLEQLAGHDLLAQVQLAWRAAYAADPPPEDLSAAVQFVLDQATHFAAHPPAADAGSKKPVEQVDPQREALSVFCQALFSSNQFLYVD